MLNADNAIWDDGEWISWNSINSELESAELRARYPNADLSLVPIFQGLLELSSGYHFATNSHLQVYGDIGELFGAITYGIKLHRNYAKRSDGRLGDDLVEIKTFTPFKKTPAINVNLDGNFSKLLIVKIDRDFQVTGRLIARKRLPKAKGKLRLKWDKLNKLM